MKKKILHQKEIKYTRLGLVYKPKKETIESLVKYQDDMIKLGKLKDVDKI